MSEVDPIVSKLLSIKRKNQELKLSSILSEVRILEQKLQDLAAEATKLDACENGFAQLSVEHGYLRYMAHRRDAILRQIAALNLDAASVQNALKKSVFSQSILDEAQ